MAYGKPHAMLLQLLVALIPLAALVATAAGGAAATSTHLQFYMHDIQTATPGNPVTAVPVARGPPPPRGAPNVFFGDVYVIDDPLTEAPGAASPVVGRAQGFYVSASRTELALLLCVNMVFTAGAHNGSYLAVQARDATVDGVRELPVVGGAGAFRGATGYGLLRTQAVNASNGNAVLKIDMYLSLAA